MLNNNTSNCHIMLCRDVYHTLTRKTLERLNEAGIHPDETLYYSQAAPGLGDCQPEPAEYLIAAM